MDKNLFQATYYWEGYTDWMTAVEVVVVVVVVAIADPSKHKRGA